MKSKIDPNYFKVGSVVFSSYQMRIYEKMAKRFSDGYARTFGILSSTPSLPVKIRTLLQEGEHASLFVASVLNKLTGESLSVASEEEIKKMFQMMDYVDELHASLKTKITKDAEIAKIIHESEQLHSISLNEIQLDFNGMRKLMTTTLGGTTGSTFGQRFKKNAPDIVEFGKSLKESLLNVALGPFTPLAKLAWSGVSGIWKSIRKKTRDRQIRNEMNAFGDFDVGKQGGMDPNDARLMRRDGATLGTSIEGMKNEDPFFVRQREMSYGKSMTGVVGKGVPAQSMVLGLFEFFNSPSGAYKAKWTKDLIEAVKKKSGSGDGIKDGLFGGMLKALGLMGLLKGLWNLLKGVGLFLLRFLGPAVAVALAGAAGYAIGAWLTKTFPDIFKPNWLSGKDGLLTKLFGRVETQRHQRERDKYRGVHDTFKRTDRLKQYLKQGMPFSEAMAKANPSANRVYDEQKAQFYIRQGMSREEAWAKVRSESLSATGVRPRTVLLSGQETLDSRSSKMVSWKGATVYPETEVTKAINNNTLILSGQLKSLREAWVADKQQVPATTYGAFTRNAYGTGDPLLDRMLCGLDTDPNERKG